jgi:hypothetical protein
VDKGHRRIETRRIAVRSVLPARLDQQWPRLMAICRIERTRETKTLCSREVIYAITFAALGASSPPDRADAACLLGLARQHWQIENGLFHVRDVTFREDHCRVRSDAAPRVLASIRRRGQTPHPAREYFAENKAEGIRVITGRG